MLTPCISTTRPRVSVIHWPVLWNGPTTRSVASAAEGTASVRRAAASVAVPNRIARTLAAPAHLPRRLCQGTDAPQIIVVLERIPASAVDSQGGKVEQRVLPDVRHVLDRHRLAPELLP